MTSVTRPRRRTVRDPLKQGIDRLRVRPVRAAALLYAALSLAFFAPALTPGHTLRNTGLQWFSAPFAGVRPAGLAAPSNPDLGDSTVQFAPWERYVSSTMPHV